MAQPCGMYACSALCLCPVVPVKLKHIIFIYKKKYFLTLWTARKCCQLHRVPQIEEAATALSQKLF